MEDIKLWHGDCLELMQDIEAGSIDAIICDPPYGTTSCKWDSVIDFGLMWEQLNRVIKPSGAIVLTATNPFSANLIMSNPKMFKYEWIWDKVTHSNPFVAKYRCLAVHEQVLVFGKGKITYNPQMIKNNFKLKGHRKNGKHLGDIFINKNKGSKRNSSEFSNPKSIITIKRGGIFGKKQKEKSYHPTQKPVLLMEYLIKTYTNENETVLDFTMGSGTTGVACQNTKRKFVGIEQDDKYFNIAQERTTANRERLSQLLF